MIDFGGMFTTILLFATPVLIAALGGLFSEKSGVVNIALEGLMLVGAFVGAVVIILCKEAGFDNSFLPWIALLCAGLVAMLFSTLHAVAAIRFKADQVISGTAINILAGGVTVFLSVVLFGRKKTPLFGIVFKKISFPVLSDIPFIGNFFEGYYPTVFLAIIIVLVVAYIMNKTVLGLRIKACGENPHAADSSGVNVYQIRYIGVLASGLLAGIAGAIMLFTQNTEFSITAIHGYGFMALAALIFGKWSVKGVVGASLFFGFSQMLGIYAKDIPIIELFPSEFFYMLPYLLTIVALVVTSSKSEGPKAVGKVFDKGMR